MSSNPNELEEGRRANKVTFSPISSELMVVRIRKVSREVREEDIPDTSRTFRPTSGDTAGHSENVNRCRSHKTNRRQKMASTSSQAECKEKTDSESNTRRHSSPCLRHAAENINRKAVDIPTEKISLCNNCSKSMLSYIFLVQDFLDSLAKEISGGDSSHCLQCAREEVRNSVATSAGSDAPPCLKCAREEARNNVSTSVADGKDLSSTSRVQSESRRKDTSDERHAGKKLQRKRGHHQESKRSETYQSPINLTHQEHTNVHANQQQQKMNFVYSVSPPSNVVQDYETRNTVDLVTEKRITVEHLRSETQYAVEQLHSESQHNVEQMPSESQHATEQVRSESQHTAEQLRSESQHIVEQQTVENRQNVDQQEVTTDHQTIYQSETGGHQIINQSAKGISTSQDNYESLYTQSTSQRIDGQSSENPIFKVTMERIQPTYDASFPTSHGDHYQDDSNNFQVQSPTLFRDDVDGIVSTLSNVEREIYDNERNRAGWEGLTERDNLERSGLPADNVIATEAFVTSCRNNAEAIGCLVVGTSLLLSRTSRTLCVLVSDGVSTAFRAAFSSVFQVVQYVRSLDSLGTTKLALLEQPELGITFEKLNIWRLAQFTKCIYLNPDTLVIQNCDELFCREELSAVPDIGWPDCFNSGVFVFSPSNHTFWLLLQSAEKQGSYDGGDQGLLNSYFTSWSTDISKKLSFIYNLMANVSYTYTPAFRQFGRDVKIVQFHGSFKPWHVKFFANSGQISPSSPVHPTYVQFVHIWLSIFRISVLRLMSQEIQSYAASQETICAVEILRFFPLPSESETEFFLTPPSVRLRLTEKKLQRSTSLSILEARRRKSAEFFRYTSPEETSEASTSYKDAEKRTEVADTTKSDISATGEQEKEQLGTSVKDADEVFKESSTIEEETAEDKTTPEKKAKDKNALPGAEVGDYQGMKAWEQGRMDYQGIDSSDNVIKRLQFLMSKPK